MPMLLKRETVRLLEASLESIYLAMIGLGLPRRIKLREESAQNAAQIGLIGAAAELAMCACLVQAYGPNYLLLESGHYKSGRIILEDFRKMLRNPVPRTLFITQGVRDEKLHRQSLYELTLKFGALITARAGGLHAGRGPTRDVCIVMARDVLQFLKTLSESSRIRPYIQNIPEVPEVVRDREIILEDLARRIRSAQDPIEKAGLLSAIYLVLPEVPEEEPKWLQAFERITIAPKEQDLSYLLDLLERSNVGSLFKVSKPGSGEFIPVVVRPNDESALPIAPQFLRRSFTEPRSQFHADVANANGRLDQNIFDVPPYNFVVELFVFGLEGTGIAQENQLFTAHQTWPFILSSMNVFGTEGPYWFLVRRTDNLNQLRAYIERASIVAPRTVKNRKDEVIKGIEAIQRNIQLSTQYARDLFMESQKAEEKRERLIEVVERNRGTQRELPEAIVPTMILVSQGDESVGGVLLKLVENGLGLTDIRAKKYWARTLSEVANDEEDLPGLLAVLRSAELDQAHTAVRKALRRIDFLSNGPSVSNQPWT